MAYLFWKDGRMQTPPCKHCGSPITDEVQELVNNDRKVRKISLKCMACGQQDYLGTFEHLGGHNFNKIRD
jgi:uncharacterized Zn finger protein